MHNYKCIDCSHEETRPVRVPYHTAKCSRCGGRLLYTGENQEQANTPEKPKQTRKQKKI
jgi:DNA-directed RNA polymerase subunit RPC12/RpoP